MTTSFNPQLLPSVKGELDSSLAALASARSELHRVKGVLQMLNLRGLAAVCAELETLLDELAADSRLDTVVHQDAIQHALLGLTHYLDALAAGAPNAALRLFPEYQELHQVRGLEMAFEVDMFFPELGVELPPE